jgi:hypothetical protein
MEPISPPFPNTKSPLFPSDISDKSTQSSANLKPSAEPEQEDLDTDEFVEANVIRSIHLVPSRRKERKLMKKSFKQELEKLGVNAKQLLDLNPTKLSPSRGQSPERDGDDKVMLPFQRRARSNSPVRQDLDLTKRHHISLFPLQGPVKASKPVVKKLTLMDQFEGVPNETEEDQDEELRTLKEEYSKLLDEAVCSQAEMKKETPKIPAKKSKITFL